MHLNIGINLWLKNIKKFLADQFIQICFKYNYDLIDFVIEPDHVHLRISTKPIVSISTVIHKLKFISDFNVLKEFPITRSTYL